MTKRPASQELEHNPILARKFAHLKLTSDSSDSIPLAQSFALSILSDRSLAQYVHHVTLNFSYWALLPPHASYYIAATPEELAKEATFRAAIVEQKWEEPDATELLKRLMRTTSPGFNQSSSHHLFPDAVVALLLPFLPNVRTFTVGAIDNPAFVGRAVQRAKDGVFGTISATHIELRPDTQYSDAAWADYSFPSFEIFAKLPALESIRGKGIGGIGIEDGGSYSGMPSQASAVREIDLKDCELSGQCISTIIGFSTGLEKFTYRFGGRTGDGGTGVVYSPQLAKALTPHRLSVKALDIDVDGLIHQGLEEEISGWRQEVEEEEGVDEDDIADGTSDTETLDSEDSKEIAQKQEDSAKSDPYFPNLKSLRIGIKLASRFAELSGRKTLAEWLPASLEELEIVGYRSEDSDDMAKQVTEVLCRREELLPNLKVLNGVKEYIENGKELENEDDYVASDEEGEESDDGGTAEEMGSSSV